MSQTSFYLNLAGPIVTVIFLTLLTVSAGSKSTHDYFADGVAQSSHAIESRLLTPELKRVDRVVSQQLQPCVKKQSDPFLNLNVEPEVLIKAGQKAYQACYNQEMLVLNRLSKTSLVSSKVSGER